MTRTRFNKKNKGFTERAHLAARKQVYPEFFQSNVPLVFENTDRGECQEHNILDRSLGVDVRVHADVEALGQSVPLHIQERFRRPSYRKFQDLTITKFNHASGEESELSKIAAQWLVYGYYDGTIDEIQEAVCVNVPILARRIAAQQIDYTDKKQNEKKQAFISVDFDELERAGVLAFHINRVESQTNKPKIDNRGDITAWANQKSDTTMTNRRPPADIFALRTRDTSEEYAEARIMNTDTDEYLDAILDKEVARDTPRQQRIAWINQRRRQLQSNE